MLDREENNVERNQAKDEAKELMLLASVREVASEKIEPVAGPWAGVAKCLQFVIQNILFY